MAKKKHHDPAKAMQEPKSSKKPEKRSAPYFKEEPTPDVADHEHEAIAKTFAEAIGEQEADE